MVAIGRASEDEFGALPWEALADQNNYVNKFGHFIAGKLYPQLRRKYFLAMGSAIASYWAMIFWGMGLLIFGSQNG